MSSVTVKTNNHPREILCWEQLTTSEKRELYSEDVNELCGSYFRYKGQVYCLDEFFRTDVVEGWDAIAGHSPFSGIVIKLVTGDCEADVIVGRYAS